jgi:hypothetical protein
VTYPEFIPQAGACLITLNAYEGRGAVRWMVRETSKSPVDNGWRIMSAIDSSDYLSNPANWRITDFNEVCAIVPELIGIWDLPVGSDLQIVRDERTRIVDTPTGREITAEHLYVPPDQRA